MYSSEIKRLRLSIYNEKCFKLRTRLLRKTDSRSLPGLQDRIAGDITEVQYTVASMHTCESLHRKKSINQFK